MRVAERILLIDDDARLDAMVNSWNQWVLGYDPKRQRDLLQYLGMNSPDWQSMGALLMIGGVYLATR